MRTAPFALVLSRWPWMAYTLVANRRSRRDGVANPVDGLFGRHRRRGPRDTRGVFEKNSRSSFVCTRHGGRRQNAGRECSRRCARGSFANRPPSSLRRERAILMVPMLARAVSVGWPRHRYATVPLPLSRSFSAGVGCCKSIFAATLDLARAFDSVEHSSIMRAAEAAGIPPLLIKYLKNLYTTSATTLSGTDWSSEPIKVTRGVKQDDSLSPVIFNLVIDQLLRSLPQECGSTYKGKTVSSLKNSHQVSG